MSIQEETANVVENRQCEAYGGGQFKLVAFDTPAELAVFEMGLWHAINWDENDLKFWMHIS